MNYTMILIITIISLALANGNNVPPEKPEIGVIKGVLLHSFDVPMKRENPNPPFDSYIFLSNGEEIYLSDRTVNNLSLAIEVDGRWAYPAEKESILAAYQYFEEWVESNGSIYKDWALMPAEDYIWKP